MERLKIQKQLLLSVRRLLPARVERRGSAVAAERRPEHLLVLEQCGAVEMQLRTLYSHQDVPSVTSSWTACRAMSTLSITCLPCLSLFAAGDCRSTMDSPPCTCCKAPVKQFLAPIRSPFFQYCSPNGLFDLLRDIALFPPGFLHTMSLKIAISEVIKFIHELL
ncbi:hypothetical protein EYF80_017743 [Liparis tanakae]|uniref:Uncharacterized protein n=1 Tax=Liparis tanakae TaxID=230148 RepID=A0A4Z2I399_9TELE|nr:hypothetical protein EYF80_017743 [Liparis tanakae]